MNVSVPPFCQILKVEDKAEDKGTNHVILNSDFIQNIYDNRNNFEFDIEVNGHSDINKFFLNFPEYAFHFDDRVKLDIIKNQKDVMNNQIGQINNLSNMNNQLACQNNQLNTENQNLKTQIQQMQYQIYELARSNRELSQQLRQMQSNYYQPPPPGM